MNTQLLFHPLAIAPLLAVLCCTSALAAADAIVAQSSAKFENLTYTVSDLKPGDGIDAVAGFQASEGQSTAWSAMWNDPALSGNAFGKGFFQSPSSPENTFLSEARSLVLSDAMRASTAIDFFSQQELPGDWLSNNRRWRIGFENTSVVQTNLLEFTMAPHSAVTFSAHIESHSSLNLSTLQALQGQEQLQGNSVLTGLSVGNAYMAAYKLPDRPGETLQYFTAAQGMRQDQWMSASDLGLAVTTPNGTSLSPEGLSTLTFTNDTAASIKGVLMMKMSTNHQLMLVPSIGAVPEPGTYALMGLGLIGMGFVRSRSQRLIDA